jgi:hypothetical protein
MTRQQLLSRLDKAWTAFTESWSGLSDAEMTGSPVKTKWSAKDLLAHVTTWEEEALKYLPLIAAGSRPPRYSTQYGGIDAFNALTAQRNKDLSLGDVIMRLNDIHGRLVSYVRTVPEELFLRETPFLRRLRLGTYGHYAKHTEAIIEWRKTLR